MSDGVWDELAIAPTEYEAAIRRAYAARLKVTRPDDDPEGFRRLRASYEAAIAWTQPAMQPASHPVAAPPAPPAFSQAILEHIANGDPATAAAMLLATRGEDTIPIGPWMGMKDFLARRIASDAEIPDEVVEGIARQFGWIDAPGADAIPASDAVRVRVAAMRWVAGIRADSAKFTRFVGNEHAAACALLAGRGRLGLSWLLPPYAALHRVLSGLAGHGAWAERAFDAKRIAGLRALDGDARGQRVRLVAMMMCVAMVFYAVGQVSWAIMAPIFLLWLRGAWQRRGLFVLFGIAAALGASGADGLRLVFVCMVCSAIAWAVYSVRQAIRSRHGRLTLPATFWWAVRVAASVGVSYALRAEAWTAEMSGVGFVACFWMLTLGPRYFKLYWRQRGPRHREVRQPAR